MIPPGTPFVLFEEDTSQVIDRDDMDFLVQIATRYGLSIVVSHVKAEVLDGTE